MSDLVVLNFIKNGCIKDARMFGWGHQVKGYLDTGHSIVLQLGAQPGNLRGGRSIFVIGRMR